LEGLRGLPIEADPSQANIVWLRAHELDGALLTARLRAEGVIVAAGGPLGADDHVRVTVRSAGATDRLLSALEKALSG
jgi:histidinol-phosphate/aromatic aminotransferase/cobyric acid decarboxylase-like protein